MIILNGDARRLPVAAESVHLVVTSPPYYNAEKYSHWVRYQDYLDDMELAWRECWRVLAQSGRICINVPMTYGRPNSSAEGMLPIMVDITKQVQQVGFSLRGFIVWDKEHYSSQANSTQWGSWMSASDPALRERHEAIIVAHKGNSKRKKGKREDTITDKDFLEFTKSVWYLESQRASWHPAPFPIDIPKRLIELYSFKGDVVLDPFSGSGTTLLAAHRLGRLGIGVELSFDYAARAWSDCVGEYGDWARAGQMRYVKKSRPLEELPLFRSVVVP